MGSPAAAQAMVKRMQEVGRPEGIKFSYGGEVGSTFDAHRLILLAGKQDKQDAVVEELFKNYFEQEKFIGDMKVLEKAGKKCDLQNLDRFMQDPKFLESELREELARYRPRANGVPNFKINGKVIGGCPEVPHLVQLFEKMDSF